MIKHQIEALADAGVTDIVLAVNYRPEIMEAHLKEVRSMPSVSRPRTVPRAPQLQPIRKIALGNVG